MTQQNVAKVSLTARLEERFFAPVRNAAFARRTWFSVTLAGIVLVHAAVLGAFLWRDREDPVQQAKLEDTPIEVIVEPPKQQMPPAPQPPARQPPAAKPMVEKPATSAPRAPNEETVDKKSEDKDTHAPKAPSPAAAVPPPQAEAKAQPEKDTPETPTEKAEAEAKPDAPKPPDVLEKDAEALDKLTPPEPPRKPAKLAQAKPVKPHQKTALQQLAGSSTLPDYTFAKPMRKRAKVTGGTEDDRYLAVVYGMITQRHNQLQLPDGEWTVAVSFQVDGAGNLVGVEVTQRSGYRQIDMAAVEAVERAAPFPPPPSGATTGLVARLRSSNDPRAMLAGQQ